MVTAQKTLADGNTNTTDNSNYKLLMQQQSLHDMSRNLNQAMVSIDLLPVSRKPMQLRSCNLQTTQQWLTNIQSLSNSS